MARGEAKRPLRVLVVDDDAEICSFLDKFLSKNGYEVTTTTDPKKTSTLLKEGTFQIVILDMVMPKIDGTEVLNSIRRFDKDLCVIVMSGFPSFDNAVNAFRKHAYDFITKPFNTNKLLEILDSAVKEYGMISDLHEVAARQIAQEVRALRTEQKLSMRQLASRTGVSASLIYQIEHAQTSPSLATISRLATALNTPLERFFAGI